MSLIAGILFTGAIPAAAKFASWIFKVIAWLAPVGGRIAGIAGFFGKWLTPIGWIYTAVMAVYGLFKELYDQWGNIRKLIKEGDIWGAILLGIKSFGVGIIKGLLGPFEWVFNWIMEKMGGQSPSLIGLAIVDGITSIGSMLLGVLTSPFKLAYDAITSIFGKLPEFITSVFKKGIDFAMQLPGIGFLMKAVGITGSEQSSQSSKSSVEPNKPSVDPNQMIINKLDELIQLMKNGGISVNMDGRKVSQALAIASS